MTNSCGNFFNLLFEFSSCCVSGTMLLHYALQYFFFLQIPTKIKECDVVVFFRFPVLLNHERLDERAMHIRCENYKNHPKKVELCLPLLNYSPNTEENWLTSEWAPGSFVKFQLLQEFPRFVRHVHPSYYPRYFDKFFRRAIYEAHITEKLKQCTFTNDDIREVTDLRYHREATETLINLDDFRLDDDTI